MIRNFASLLADVVNAKTRSQLEYAYDTANTFLTTWLDAHAINSVDFHSKMAQLNDAYQKQLIDLSESRSSALMPMLGAIHDKAANEVKS